MAERICIPFAHTYDQFAAFFYEGRVYLSDTSYPIGQCCVDIVNMDEEVLSEIDRCVEEFIPAARKLLMEKTNSAVAFAQEKLNAVWDIIFTMPVYRDLNMDLELSYHSLERLYEQKDKWAQVQDVHSEGREMYERMLNDLAHFADRVRALRLQLRIMTEKYFEPLKRRNSTAYGTAYSTFYADMLRTGALLFGEDFDQKFSVEIDFVPMMRKENEREFFVAEKTTFNYLHDFLRTEFYRGLAIGNAPRQCHNCGKYFLLTAGYNTCYCGNIAPGETERTCRKVGAHRKEAQGKANRSPARVEYDRTYNRLKQRKVRGKISADEWNAAVAKATQVLEQAERGELTEGEVTSRAEQKENDLRQKQEIAKIQTLRQYGEKVFMPAKTVTMSENGRCAYQGNLDHWIYPALGELKMPDITAADISALLLSMQSAGKANATCVKVYTILHSLFKMAYMSDVLSVNPMDRVGRPKPRKSERRDKPIEAYTASELQRIFSAIDTEPLKWRVLMRLLIDTGIRRGRVLRPSMEGHRLQRVYRNDQRQPVLYPAKGCLLGYSEKRKGADDRRRPGDHRSAP